MRPPAADDVRGHEKIEQLAEPLHEGRNDERTERCRRSTRGLAAVFATEAEPAVNAKVKAWKGVSRRRLGGRGPVRCRTRSAVRYRMLQEHKDTRIKASMESPKLKPDVPTRQGIESTHMGYRNTRAISFATTFPLLSHSICRASMQPTASY